MYAPFWSTRIFLFIFLPLVFHLSSYHRADIPFIWPVNLSPSSIRRSDEFFIPSSTHQGISMLRYKAIHQRNVQQSSHYMTLVKTTSAGSSPSFVFISFGHCWIISRCIISISLDNKKMHKNYRRFMFSLILILAPSNQTISLMLSVLLSLSTMPILSTHHILSL